MNRNQLVRLLKIERIIRSCGYPSRERLAREVGVCVKTVQRDLTYLKRQLEAPLHFDAGKKGYTFTEAGWFLPAIRITMSDIQTLRDVSRFLRQSTAPNQLIWGTDDLIRRIDPQADRLAS